MTGDDVEWRDLTPKTLESIVQFINESPYYNRFRRLIEDETGEPSNE